MNDGYGRLIANLASAVEKILRKLQAIADWQRWAEQRIRELARAPYQAMANGGGLPGYYDTAIVAKSTSSIGARSGATYGTGTVKIQADGGSSLSDFSPTTTFTAKNLLNKSIESDAYVLCVRVKDGWWIVAVGDCENLG